jgi:hypothetical protein
MKRIFQAEGDAKFYEFVGAVRIAGDSFREIRQNIVA